MNNKMDIIDWKVFFIMIFIVIIAALVISLYMGNFSNYDKSALHTFISIVTGLGFIVIFTFYFANLESMTQGDDIEYKKEISHINELVYITIPSKIASNGCDKCDENLHTVPLCTNCNCKGCKNLSYTIFSSWKRFILYSKYLKKEGDLDGYLNLFSNWTKNEHLKLHWDQINKHFDSKTIKFGDALFLGKSNTHLLKILNS